MAQINQVQQQESGIDKFLRRLGGVTQAASQGYGLYNQVKNAPLERKKLQYEADPVRLQAEADQKKAGVDFDKKTNIRKEITNLPVYKATSDVSNSYSRLIESQKKPSAASDMTLIYQYMKMVDPGSTVREGEFANAQNATGIPGQISNMYNKMVKGERLNEVQRKEFLNQSKALYDGQMSQYNQALEQYKGIAEREKLDYNDINPNIGVIQQAPQAPGVNELIKNKPQAKTVSPEDMAAIEWAKANPQNPSSAKILQLHGVK